MSLHASCELILPHWLDRFMAQWSTPLQTPEQRMQLAIALAAENVRQQTGGPFGAIVVEEESGRLLSVGVNLVTTLDLSLAHAEMVALSLAQSAARNWNLSTDCRVQLVTSCEPCAMCFGAVPWSGVSSIIWGASKAEADKPDHWADTLERRGIRTSGGVLHKEAAAVLVRYARRKGAIYHPERN